MKPIEPGCLALVIRDEDAGMVVTCVQYCPPGYRYRSSSTGEIKKSVVAGWITSDPDFNGLTLRAECELMRIDGDESVTTETREAETT